MATFFQKTSFPLKRSFFYLSIIFLLGFALPLEATEEPLFCVETHCFSIELADTPDSRARGLMYRQSLGFLSGMLFSFDRDERWSFWMKNTFIPLDIIWLDSEYRVVDTHSYAKPMDTTALTPDVPARYVFEVNAGVVNYFKISKGQVFYFK